MKLPALFTARSLRRAALVVAVLAAGAATASPQRRTATRGGAASGNAGAAAPTGPIALAYHFQPGQVMQTQTRMQADLKMAFGAQPAQPPQQPQELPIRVDSTGTMTRRVT